MMLYYKIANIKKNNTSFFYKLHCFALFVNSIEISTKKENIEIKNNNTTLFFCFVTTILHFVNNKDIKEK